LKNIRCTSAPGFLACLNRHWWKSRLAGPARSSLASKWRCIRCIDAEFAAGANGSPLFGFLSLQRVPTRFPISPQAASLKGYPASTFLASLRSYEPLLFVGNRFQASPTTAGHLRSCAAGLFLGVVPLPLWQIPVWLIRPPPFVVRRCSEPTTLLGFVSLRSFKSGRIRVKRFFNHFGPACRSMNVHLDSFYSRDRPPSYVLRPRKRSADHGRSFRLPGFALRPARDAILGLIALPMLSWVFPVSGFTDAHSAFAGAFLPIKPPTAAGLVTRPAIRSWVCDS